MPVLAGGLDLKLTLLNQSQYVTTAQVVQANLAEVGINLNLDVLDGGAFWSQGEGEAGENLELSLQQFGGKADPSFQTQWFVSEQVGEWNWQRWKSADFDKLNVEAELTTDEAKRAELYVQMQKLMDESAAYVWLTHEVNIFASKKWLQPLGPAQRRRLAVFRLHGKGVGAAAGGTFSQREKVAAKRRMRGCGGGVFANASAAAPHPSPWRHPLPRERRPGAISAAA